MELLKKVVGYLVLALQVLIIVILIFEDRISLPSYLQAVGRIHPLMLHLPIGLLLITTLIAFGRRFFTESYDQLFTFLLYLSAFTASLSAFMGLILSFEGGYDETDLVFHKWFGIALSFIGWGLISFNFSTKILRPVLLITTLLLVVTGHFGANLTHGQGFIFGPLATTEIKTRLITDSSTVFTSSIDLILEAKCYSCHNEEKAKGKLILTSQASIETGGKNGRLWKGNESLLMERLNLPLDHKKHMPPKDKTQLADDEINLIGLWIAKGANFKTQLNELPAKDTLRILSTTVIQRYYKSEEPKSIYTFASASSETIKKLNTPYRTVFQIAANEPALQVDFFLAESFQKVFLGELKIVSDQVVIINLSKMPVTDEELKSLARFPNLEKLILNQTKIEGKKLSDLNNLQNLRSLSLASTKVSADHLPVLAKNKRLTEVYLWNTLVTEKDLSDLKNKFSSIDWQIGYVPDNNEILQLSPPILRNDGQVLKPGENISYRHNLPGSIIRYSVNGEMPDSVSGEVYKDPIDVKQYSIVKTKAFKDGWMSSKGVESIFFPSGIKPDRATLLTKPEDRYKGEGGTTLIDTRKGMPDFYRDPVWMGFRNENLEAIFWFDKNVPEVSSVTLSYARNIGAMCMPPSEMQVWGGKDENHLKLLASLKPAQPTDYVSTRIEGADIKIPKSNFKCYKVIAKTLTKLPAFRKAPNDKGWLMVDEIFFN